MTDPQTEDIVGAHGESEPLHSPDVGLRVIRGGSIRAGGYGVGMLLTAAASVLLLRYLGVADFGRYMTVTSLIAIVGGLADAGLTAVGGRELALHPLGAGRNRLLANLVGLRLVLTPVGVAAATLFAIAAGYAPTLVIGTVLVGVGLVLTSWQATMTLPLSVELRIGRLTFAETIKQAVMLAGIAVLVAAGADLLPFFALAVGVAVIMLALTPALVGRGLVWRPAFDRLAWRTLIREALPLAASVVMGVLYFRVLIVLMSLLASAFETGLYATSFRIVEILYGVSALIATTALPVLAVAAADRTRLAYILQRMTEVALIAAFYFVVIVIVLAEPALDILGGPQYGAAAPVLRIQVLALIPIFFAHVCQTGLISIRRQSALMAANGLALVLVLALGLALVPEYGAKGAAIAAVAAEITFASVLLVALVRSDASLRPSLRFVWKLAAASGLAAAAALLLNLPASVAAAVATAIYGAVLAVTRAVPREVLDSFTVGRSA